MKNPVAVVDSASFTKAIELIGGVNELNSPERRVVVKVGIYNPETGICSTVETVKAISKVFDKATEILIAESDSGAGPGLDRLKVWKNCYTDRIVPFNLSDDEETSLVKVAGEKIPFSHVLLEKNTFISTHVPRRYEKAGLEDLMNMGFVIKNLLGLVLDTKKHRFHDQLPTALLDMYEAAGGIDLAVLDATHVFLGWKKKRITVSPQVLIVGKDAFAVETVGAHLMGFNPFAMPVLQEASDRDLGEINIDKIEVIGDIEPAKQLIQKALKQLVPKTAHTAQDIS
ncbi:MAG: DUF362 domain-containing protein [Candidatus Thorarchaeota archaeon]